MQNYPYQQAPFGPNYNVTTRPITVAECNLVVRLAKNMRGAIIGVGVIAIFLAILNFFLPFMVLFIFTCVMSLVSIATFGLSVRNRKLFPKMNEALSKGIVTDVSGIPVKESRDKWSLGPVYWPPNSELAVLVTEGQPVTLGCLPTINLVVSVNGLPLKRWGFVKGLDKLNPPMGAPHAPAQGFY